MGLRWMAKGGYDTRSTALTGFDLEEAFGEESKPESQDAYEGDHGRSISHLCCACFVWNSGGAYLGDISFQIHSIDLHV